MKAMVLHELGGAVTLEEMDKPGVGPSDALVRVGATGVGLTVIIMKNTPGLVSSYPRILGHEVAGEVVDVGTEVRNVKRGDRVACHFYLTCGVCRFCRSGRDTLCASFQGYVSMAELIEILQIVRQFKIRLIVTQVFPLEEAEKVHRLLTENRITGRAALTF